MAGKVDYRLRNLALPPQEVYQCEAWRPAVDVYRGERAWLIKCDLAGVRREEIEVLELVGATSHFIRTPFLLEGVVLGLIASLCSLALSYGMHSLLLHWLAGKWSFWLALQSLTPLPGWQVAVNLVSGVAFGALGAWNCVRRLNTGWSAAAG